MNIETIGSLRLEAISRARRVSAAVLGGALLFLLSAPAAPLSGQAFEELSEEVRQYVAVEGPSVVLRNVTLLDGSGEPAEQDQTVVVRDARIAAVGAAGEVEIPEGAEVLDLEGHTVIPGIIGLHNHLFYAAAAGRVPLPYSAPRLYLGAGVTTIRTAGSYAPYEEINLKRRVEAGGAPGPRMHVTGPYLTGSEGSSYQYDVQGPEDARRVVRYWAEEGVPWFKIYQSITRDELRAAVEEAHEHGIQVTGHLCSVTFDEAIEAGIDNLEHGFITNSGWYPDKEPDVCPADLRQHLAGLDVESPEVQATIQAMVENDVALTATLAVLEALVPGRPPLQQRVLDAMEPATRENHLAMREEIEDEGEGGAWPSLFQKELAFDKAFADAGGLLGAGVDPTGNGGAIPGYGDQRNYELLLEAGFTPGQAVRIMTANGARILGEGDRLGAVEAGKLADLVVLEGSLPDDPTVIRNVRLVFKDGVGYDPARLIEDVEGRIGAR